MGKLITIPQRSLDADPNERTIEQSAACCCHKTISSQKITTFLVNYPLYFPLQRCHFRNCFTHSPLSCVDPHQSQRHSSRMPPSMSMWLRNQNRKRRSQQERSERRDWNATKQCWNATTTFPSLSNTRKHCARLLLWRSELCRLSKMIPMNVSMFTATQLTPKSTSSKSTRTNKHESRYSQQRFYRRSSHYSDLLSTNLCPPITNPLFHIRNDSAPEPYRWTFNIWCFSISYCHWLLLRLNRKRV